MNIKTTNPVVVDKTKISPSDFFSNATADVEVDYEYLPTEEITAGDLKVVTKYPIVLDGTDVSPRDYYSNAIGDRRRRRKTETEVLADATEKAAKTGQTPAKAEQDVAKQKGLFWDNAKKSWRAFTNSEAGKMALSQIDAALTARREAKYGSGQGGAILPASDTTITEPSKPMSATTKILLIGGGILVVGLIVYSVIASKGTATATAAK